MSGLLLRVDCEHVEAERWAGDATLEPRATRRLLGLLRELDARASFAFVGATAAAYPELTRAARDDGHAVLGHSMRHAGPYAGRDEAWQLDDMVEMVAAIDEACGVRVRGLAAPGHGAIDAATLRAAHRAGFEYVLNFSVTAPEHEFAAAPGSPVLVPPAAMRVVWDWTALQPGWPPFSAEQARREWMAALRADGLVELIVHPWIVELNDEYGLLADLLGRIARPLKTFEEVATYARV